MKDMTEVKNDFKRTTRKARKYLSTPTGKKYGLIALAVGVGAAALLYARARRAR